MALSGTCLGCPGCAKVVCGRNRQYHAQFRPHKQIVKTNKSRTSSQQLRCFTYCLHMHKQQPALLKSIMSLLTVQLMLNPCSVLFTGTPRHLRLCRHLSACAQPDVQVRCRLRCECLSQQRHPSPPPGHRMATITLASAAAAAASTTDTSAPPGLQAAQSHADCTQRGAVETGAQCIGEQSALPAKRPTHEDGASSPQPATPG